MKNNDNKKFEDTVKTVKRINNKLRAKGFKLEHIDKFWTKLINLIPKIKEVGLENIKVCTGCGKLNIEDLPAEYHACCPDSHYIHVHPYELDEKGFVFLDSTKQPYYVALLFNEPHAMRWCPDQKRWLTFRKLRQEEVLSYYQLRISEAEADYYHKLDALKTKR